ncbi:MAG: hypothetical protein KGY80_04575 [Candidatus Thorarchaeota archaeon]|nr:hypothetical protein [Candidatus Thorarchaeota archaeon]
MGKKGKTPLSSLVPKHHFVGLNFFRQPPLVNWEFTDSVLFTAYDFYRTSSFWIERVIRQGMTLKEALVDMGFPKENRLLADTGVFSIEARKAGIARELGIEPEIELRNEQIFHAYSVSGADLFVAPDEIVVPDDRKEEGKKKVSIIKDNFLDLLEVVPPSKVLAVIQAPDKPTAAELFDFYKSHGVTTFAAGGLIPLWKSSAKKLRDMLKYIRKLTDGYWLHAFGLPRIRLLPYYIHIIGINSVDSSMLLYLSAKKRYIDGLKVIPVRKADFSTWQCPGCANMKEKPVAYSYQFFINLYIHNIHAATNLTLEAHEKSKLDKYIDKVAEYRQKRQKKKETRQKEKYRKTHG